MSKLSKGENGSLVYFDKEASKKFMIQLLHSIKCDWLKRNLYTDDNAVKEFKDLEDVYIAKPTTCKHCGKDTNDTKFCAGTNCAITWHNKENHNKKKIRDKLRKM